MPFSFLPRPFTLYFYSCFKSCWEKRKKKHVNTNINGEKHCKEWGVSHTSVEWVCQVREEKKGWLRERKWERCECYAGTRIFPGSFHSSQYSLWSPGHSRRKGTRWSLCRKRELGPSSSKTVVTFIFKKVKIVILFLYTCPAPPEGKVDQEVFSSFFPLHFSICLSLSSRMFSYILTGWSLGNSLFTQGSRILGPVAL